MATGLGGHAPLHSPDRGGPPAGEPDPAARLRGLSGAAQGNRGGRGTRPEGGLPPHRHRGRISQRGRGRGGRARIGARSGRGVPHHEVLQQRSWLRAGQACLHVQPRATSVRVCRPLPHPLAGPGPRPLCRYVEGLHRPSGRGTRADDRSIELPARPSEARGGRDRGDAVHQPGRAASLLPAGAPTAGARGARHRHRGMEPPRAGPGARRPGPQRDRRRHSRTPGQSSSAGTCRWATW